MWNQRFTLFLALVVGLVTSGHAIDCYKCTSINEMSEECEDEFDRGISTVHLIKRECVYGHFKGTHCIKLKGERDDGTKITVRDCSDSDWGHHCGDIRYLTENNEQRITGCLEACGHDGCNKSTHHAPGVFFVVLFPVVVVVLTFLTQNHIWRVFLP